MTRPLKVQISVAAADQNMARAIEALKTARVMLKGANPNWDAAGNFMLSAQDMIRETITSIVDAQMDRFKAVRGDD